MNKPSPLSIKANEQGLPYSTKDLAYSTKTKDLASSTKDLAYSTKDLAYSTNLQRLKCINKLIYIYIYI